MARFQPDHKGIAAFIRSDEVVKATKRVADQIADVARANAPVETGEYARGIKVERNDAGGIRGDRVVFEVVATGGHPTLVEWGRNPGNGSPGYAGDHVMQRAVEEVTAG